MRVKSLSLSLSLSLSDFSFIQHFYYSSNFMQHCRVQIYICRCIPPCHKQHIPHLNKIVSHVPTSSITLEFQWNKSSLEVLEFLMKQFILVIIAPCHLQQNGHVGDIEFYVLSRPLFLQVFICLCDNETKRGYQKRPKKKLQWVSHTHNVIHFQCYKATRFVIYWGTSSYVKKCILVV